MKSLFIVEKRAIKRPLMAINGVLIMSSGTGACLYTRIHTPNFGLPGHRPLINLEQSRKPGLSSIQIAPSATNQQSCEIAMYSEKRPAQWELMEGMRLCALFHALDLQAQCLTPVCPTDTSALRMRMWHVGHTRVHFCSDDLHGVTVVLSVHACMHERTASHLSNIILSRFVERYGGRLSSTSAPAKPFTGFTSTLHELYALAKTMAAKARGPECPAASKPIARCPGVVSPPHHSLNAAERPRQVAETCEPVVGCDFPEAERRTAAEECHDAGLVGAKEIGNWDGVVRKQPLARYWCPCFGASRVSDDDISIDVPHSTETREKSDIFIQSSSTDRLSIPHATTHKSPKPTGSLSPSKSHRANPVFSSLDEGHWERITSEDSATSSSTERATSIHTVRKQELREGKAAERPVEAPDKQTTKPAQPLVEKAKQMQSSESESAPLLGAIEEGLGYEAQPITDVKTSEKQVVEDGDCLRDHSICRPHTAPPCLYKDATSRLSAESNGAEGQRGERSIEWVLQEVVLNRNERLQDGASEQPKESLKGNGDGAKVRDRGGGANLPWARQMRPPRCKSTPPMSFISLSDVQRKGRAVKLSASQCVTPRSIELATEDLVETKPTEGLAKVV